MAFLGVEFKYVHFSCPVAKNTGKPSPYGAQNGVSAVQHSSSSCIFPFITLNTHAHSRLLHDRGTTCI